MIKSYKMITIFSFQNLRQLNTSNEHMFLFKHLPTTCSLWCCSPWVCMQSPWTFITYNRLQDSRRSNFTSFFSISIVIYSMFLYLLTMVSIYFLIEQYSEYNFIHNLSISLIVCLNYISLKQILEYVNNVWNWQFLS